MTIDLNCDMGESYGNFKIGNDEAVFASISSCNIACGAHGGDPVTIEKTVKLAVKHNVQIGAHPSYPDLAGFGRRKMHLSKEELMATIKSQIAIIDGLSRSHNGLMQYVKPHGALYNSLQNDAEEAAIFTQAVKSYRKDLSIMGLPKSELHKMADKHDVNYICEGFIDRLYQNDGSLMPRGKSGAVLTSIDEMIDQFKSIVLDNTVRTGKNEKLRIKVDSLCIHGDNPKIVALLESLSKILKSNGIAIKKSLTP